MKSCRLAALLFVLTTVVSGVNVLAGGDSRLGTATSSRRWKLNVEGATSTAATATAELMNSPH
jgi:hypothetical protein